MLLLSNGAWSRMPIMGKTQVVTLFAMDIQSYVSAPSPQRASQPARVMTRCSPGSPVSLRSWPYCCQFVVVLNVA